MAEHHTPEYFNLLAPTSDQTDVMNLNLQVFSQLSFLLGVLTDQQTQQLTTLTESIEYSSD
jgi:hypothetical protein